jgi:hypothetical protein
VPEYIRQCTTTVCGDFGRPFRHLARASEFKTAEDMDRKIRCRSCGGPTEVHPEQFGTVSIQRTWSRAGGGVERESKAMAFQEAGIPEVKRDCPSMDFKVRDGEAVPVFHNDKHHRQCMKELSGAKRRYEGERQAERAAKRKKVDKRGVIKALKRKAGLI